NDTWALSLSGTPEWNLLDPGTGPTTDFFAEAAIYDPRRDRIVLFGRNDRMTELWAFDLSDPMHWSRLEPEGTGPAWDLLGEAIYDPVRDRLILVGPDGDNAQSTAVWELPFSGVFAWSRVATSGSIPPGRYRATRIYDPVRDRALRFGGTGLAYLPDGRTWELSLSGMPTWSELPEFPGTFFNHASVYDPGRVQMLPCYGNSKV